MRLFESPDPPPSGPTAEHRTDAHPGPASETWSVGEFHAAVRSALARRFRGRVWVHGELRARTRNARSGHCYLTLADPHGGRRGGEATLDVVFWSDRWDDVASRLEAAGVVLEEGAELRLRGEVTTWDQGRVMLVADRLDVEGLVGRLAAARARLVRALVAEGLWDRNRDRPAPVLPLRVGLVAAPASDGYHDFVRRLLDSGYAFVVTVAAATVQGTGAPRAVAGALRRLGEHHRSDPLDVVVLVRGGGSRADLAAFDHEDVARAVAGCPVPVWTGIGHSSDTCLADELAHGTLATPPAAAAAL
ncbi:MAG: exodeoxyribonuclease VII large subunit, partial [Acidimicrobiia bacterium]|nr:exodeoxyribonuclease VII large subunit [Acidimicrobiia bacterium]